MLHTSTIIKLFGIVILITFLTSFWVNKDITSTTPNPQTKKEIQDTNTYHKILLKKKDSFNSSAGTKSVLFNSTGTKLYAMNLEGLSVYEFDEPTRQLLRIFKFKATKGFGWDYTTHEKIESFQEKPVEACFSNHDSILWVSLHNAKGVVPIFLEEDFLYEKTKDSLKKKIYVKDILSNKKDSSFIPLIITGKTPKVIAKTADDKYLLVSNWHSKTISVLAIHKNEYPYATLVSTITVSAIPRGIVVDDEHQKTYIAIMGGNSIIVVNNQTWKIEKEITVSSSPRHIVMDNKNRLFISYNNSAKVGCVDVTTGKKLFEAKTKAQPRTIVLSKNKQFLFVTCYAGNTLDVFKINDTSFQQLYSVPCRGKPVGVDVCEDNEKLEAWVCNYVGGNIKVFTFKKEQ